MKYMTMNVIIPLTFLPKKFHNIEREFMWDVYYFSKMTGSRSMHGGSKIEETNKQYQFANNKITYTFDINKMVGDGMTRISVVGKNELDCVTVLIHDGDKIAYLNNMSYSDDCTRPGLAKPGGGTVLLKIINKYLTSKKHSLGINKIVLKDNSFLSCPKCNDTVKLARLKMILNGTTWYTSHGYKPRNSELQKLDKSLLKGIVENHKLIRTLKINEIDLVKILKNIKKNNKITYSVNEIYRIAKKYILISLIIDRLNQEFNKYCCLIENILQEVFKPNGLKKPLMYDMHGKLFYLDL